MACSVILIVKIFLSVQKLENAVGGHQHFQGSSSGFVIHHYAGKVDILHSHFKLFSTELFIVQGAAK